MSWDFGGAYADTAGKLQKQDIEARRAPLELQQLQAQVQAIPLEMQLLRAKVEAAPIALEEARADVRYKKALTDAAEHKLKADQNLASIMGEVKLDDDEAPSTSILKMAGALAKAGDGRGARDALLRASQARAAEATAEFRGTQQAEAETRKQLKLADRYTALLSGVKSQEDLDRANFAFQSETGEEPPAMRYDPRTIELLRESTKKMADRIREQRNAVLERQGNARIANTEKWRKELKALREQEERGRENRAAARTKNDGKDVGAPSGTEQSAAERLLSSNEKTAGLDKETRKQAAYDLAARARALRRNNPALDAGEAMQRALGEQISEGYFTTKRASGVHGLFGGKKPTYSRPGGSADKPLDPPSDVSKAKPYTYYKTPKGTLLYLGNGKWQVPETENEEPDEPDDDEDEE